jgi:hypothetical protein
MQQQHPAFYTQLASHLTSEEQNVITTALHQAEQQMAINQGMTDPAANGGTN